MDKRLFAEIRRYLGKTQAEMAHLLGTSLKAVQSFEQGWRRIPPHAERQALFFLSRKTRKEAKPCWELMNCPEERKVKCPAWEFQTGELCWFINGTMCQGTAKKTWREKMERCLNCGVFCSIFPDSFQFAPRLQGPQPPCPEPQAQG
jgi:DNA-binding XRE family transcriptional regulator